jgi:hypothetical protein
MKPDGILAVIINTKKRNNTNEHRNVCRLARYRLFLSPRSIFIVLIGPDELFVFDKSASTSTIAPFSHKTVLAF